MDRSVEYIGLAMVKRDLTAIPAFELPDGYAIRMFRASDERFWVDIEMQAGEFSSPEKGHDAFDRDFRPAYDRLQNRMFLLEHESDGPIGTATAWEGEHAGRMMGQVHWVAIVPEHQGRGLAKPLLAAVLRRLAEEHDELFLTTQTWSWRAVAMYRAFGFTEVIDRPEVERAIAIINAKLAEPRR